MAGGSWLEVQELGAGEGDLPTRLTVEPAEAKPPGGIVCEGASPDLDEPNHAYVAEGSGAVASAFWALLLRAGYTVW